MNFKAWNMRKGLKRIWILGSVFWFAVPFFKLKTVWCTSAEIIAIDFCKFHAFMAWASDNLVIGAVYVGLWWALFYVGIWVIRGFVFLGRWVARGFKDDDDKKAGF